MRASVQDATMHALFAAEVEWNVRIGGKHFESRRLYTARSLLLIVKSNCEVLVVGITVRILRRQQLCTGTSS
jgi:hypothetical protein